MNILFIERQPFGVHGGQIGFPGGNIQKEELPVDCVLRELKEEVDLIINKNDLKLLAMNYCFYFTTNIYSGNIKLQVNEISNSHWVSISILLNIYNKVLAENPQIILSSEVISFGN